VQDFNRFFDAITKGSINISRHDQANVKIRETGKIKEGREMQTYIGFEEGDVVLIERRRALLLEEIIGNVRHDAQSSEENGYGVAERRGWNGLRVSGAEQRTGHHCVQSFASS